MAKDYAKRVFTTSRKPQKKRQRLELFVIPIVLLVCIAGYWGYLHKSNLKFADAFSLTHIKNLLSHKKDINKPVQTAKADNALAKPSERESDVHFDFYNELPKMQVTVPEEADAAPPPKPVVKVRKPDNSIEEKITQAVKSAAEDKYILQFGLFKNQIEASQTRVSLLLAGGEAKVLKIDTSKGVMYRVQSERLANESEAKKMQRELEEKGIASEIKKV